MLRPPAPNILPAVSTLSHSILSRTPTTDVVDEDFQQVGSLHDLWNLRWPLVLNQTLHLGMFASQPCSPAEMTCLRMGEVLGRSKLSPSVFMRIMSGADWDISGFQPASISPERSSTTQAAGALALSVSHLAHRRGFLVEPRGCGRPRWRVCGTDKRRRGGWIGFFAECGKGLLATVVSQETRNVYLELQYLQTLNIGQGFRSDSHLRGVATLLGGESGEAGERKFKRTTCGGKKPGRHSHFSKDRGQCRSR